MQSTRIFKTIMSLCVMLAVVGSAAWASLHEPRQPDPAQPFQTREYGVARYERLQGTDFAAATDYFDRTRAFWDEVGSAWATLSKENEQITLRAPVDQAGLFQKLFAYADKLADRHTPDSPQAQVIRESLNNMGAPAFANNSAY